MIVIPRLDRGIQKILDCRSPQKNGGQASWTMTTFILHVVLLMDSLVTINCNVLLLALNRYLHASL